eukprot:gene41071-50105_t
MAKQVVGTDMVGRKGLLGNEDRTLEDDELVWIQCARLLLTLTQPELNDLCTCLKKILNNLIDHPGEEKFSTLKFSNEHLKKHLFAYNGGKEILMGVGFRSDLLIDGKGGEEKVLRLPVGYAQHPQPFVEQSRACLGWLDHTAQRIAALIERKQQLGIATLRQVGAELICSVQLPTREVAKGGFLLRDTAQDVYQFAQSFFQLDAREHVCVREPHQPAPLENSCA